ncbi:SNF2-related protein [Mucisphaera sp.]|uniref:SNF2-related protein n=1 Tax=Mucisphaera sp. TaxID=2913024 RepID=UPI003D139904
MSLVTSWSPFFQSDERVRGRSLQQAGAVKRLPPEAEGELVRFSVEDGETHIVIIRQEGRAAYAECDCEIFDNGLFCRHIWAGLVDLQANPSIPGTAELSRQLFKLSVRPPRARKRPEQARPQTRSEPEWSGRLTLLRPGSMERIEPDVEDLLAPRRIQYVVRVDLCHRHHQLVIELRQQTPIARGWSRPRALRLGASTLAGLTETTDREIATLLVGASVMTDAEETSIGRSDRSGSLFALPRVAAERLLRQITLTGRAVLLTDPDTGSEEPLAWDDNGPWHLSAVGRWDDTRENLRFGTELRRGTSRVPIHKPSLLLTGPGGVVVVNGKAAPFDDAGAGRWAGQFRDHDPIDDGDRSLTIPKTDIDRFLDRLYRLPQIPDLDLPEGVGRSVARISPKPRLEILSAADSSAGNGSSTRQQLLARLSFDYGSARIDWGTPGTYVTPPDPEHQEDAPPTPEDGQSQPEALAAETTTETAVKEPQQDLILRDRSAERAAAEHLGRLGLRSSGNAESGQPVLVIRQRDVLGVVSDLIARGWEVLAEDGAVRRPADPRLSVRSGIDWFELRGDVTYTTDEGETVTVELPKIIEAVRAGRNLIRLDDGSTGLLPEEWLADRGLLTALGKAHGDHLRFGASQAALLDTMLSTKEGIETDEAFDTFSKALAQSANVEPLDPDPTFQGKLRTYQKTGLGWLRFLRQLRLGGILADDMGLGKTIQVLAMLQARIHHGTDEPSLDPNTPEGTKLGQPALIVAPRSVVYNWLDEAEHFTPELRVLGYTGPDRANDLRQLDQYDLVVTSYGLLRRDIEELSQVEFDYAILDEAQAIKNPMSQVARASRLIQARHRLALTGTPIENHLGDLWSIFEYLNPGMLGVSSKFSDLVKASSNRSAMTTNASEAPPPNEVIEAEADDEDDSVPALQQLAKALRPMILRRTKDQVLKDLPPKTEQTILCEMDPDQRKVYDQMRDHYRGQLLTQLDAAGAASTDRVMRHSSVMVLEALLRLRQAACHPALISPEHQTVSSAKLDALMEMMEDLIEEGHKVLIFSQFTSMLALVRQRFEKLNIPLCYLDGQTRNRKEEVERFQNSPKIPAFLISLKAGGVGLNLTAAGYVFILDPWWNPAAEAQAIDRTHRIGQTKPVFAYRMICEGTVEQRIQQLQKRKKRLAEAVVDTQGDEGLSELSREDLEMLLS